jgi:isoleucyl-tRNA synthetase
MSIFYLYKQYTMQDNQQQSISQKEESILAFWQREGVFEASLDRATHSEAFVFYDGPPFGTGTPHYGHLLAGTLKDILPRYHTMKGAYVRRNWGWDCHGLPVENIVEKALALSTKKDIEVYGISAFNQAAKETVLTYADDWRQIVPRSGRFVDMDNDYKTMNASYTESVWWAFKSLYDKQLIYEGYSAMQLCPRCETTLSNFEVSQGYKDITDISVYALFALTDEERTYVVAWTTTPWTLPGNVALAVGQDFDYVKIEIEESYYIIAKERLGVVTQPYHIVDHHVSLIGRSYVPVFDY